MIFQIVAIQQLYHILNGDKHIILKLIMIFHSEQFRQAVEGNNPRTTIGVLGKLIYTLQGQRQSVYAIRMMQQIAGIIRGQSQSPILKFKTTKMLIYLIVMADGQVLQLFADQVYPMIRNACLFNRNQPLITRGIDFFRNNKYYQIANYDEKTKIKNIGCKYLCFCLECVLILNQWLPKNPGLDSDSIYRTSYKMLIKQGVQFPRPDELTFFSEQKIEKIEQIIKKCQEEARNLQQEYDAEYFQEGRSKFNAEMMNGVEYLQKKLKEKEKIISEMKVNTSVMDLQKNSYQTRLQQYQQSHNTQVDRYQKRIAELTDEVRIMKDIVRKEQKTDPERQIKQQEMIASLQAKMQLLLYENSQLKEQLRKKSSIIQQMAYELKKQPSELSTQPLKSQQYIKELMQIGQEPKQFEPRHTQKHKIMNSFFEYKDLRENYHPLYELLSPEMQVRFKKCLLKSKQILFKNKHLQIGIITLPKNDIEVHMTIIITNLTENSLTVEQIQYHCSSQQQVIEKEGGRKRLKMGQQLKKDIVVVVNSIDGRCPSMMTSYYVDSQNIHEKISVLLPIGKMKLAEFVPFTSHPYQQWQNIQRVFTLEKRILSSLSKLKVYFPRVFVEKHGGQNQYCFKIILLQTTFYLRLNAVGQETVRMLVSFKQENKCLADKVVDELKFILAK